ncbi:hypothetical protein [Flavobacterium paronense]|uniref:hypothetical protein n=1 Tax=Flavobacterium paronense TaxID=1392775 RepID=UPI003014AAFE
MLHRKCFVECQFGYEKGQQYVNGCKRNIDNVSPIIGPYGVNKEGSGDMYEKGALLLNTLRHVVNDDDKWWKLFLKYSETFHNKIIDTEAVISFFNTETGMNLTPIFNQYLRHASIPKLELRKSKANLGFVGKQMNLNSICQLILKLMVKNTDFIQQLLGLLQNIKSIS